MAATDQTSTSTSTITGTWNVDRSHSSLGFAVRHSGVATFRGEVGEFQGSLDASGGELRLVGTGSAASLSTGSPDRDAHLSSPDFFDAERHPELRFESTRIERDGDEVVVRGDLTLRGTTRPVELRGELVGPVVDAFGTPRVGLELSGKVDRTEYGISWNAPLPGGDLLLSNTVKIEASFSLTPAS
jgi:polyisoprenoid-binding protein YceI